MIRAVAACACVVARLALAQAPGDEPISVTHHQVTLDGRTLGYTARAGRIAIRDNDDGAVHGQMFFVSYTLDRADSATARPITFAWNGGPGSNAALVHLIGFGPKRIVPPGSRDDERARWVVQDNPGTWLEFTDLVFVDPIGTGYSRVTKPEYTKEFYSTTGDAESVAEFIRVYRLRYGAEDAPLFLAGESYGVTRAANVALALTNRGTRVNGVVLMGLEPPIGEISEPMKAALAVPNYTVAAFTHHRLAADLQADIGRALDSVERWSQRDYADALARVKTLTAAQREAVAQALARYTGLDASAIDRKTLVVPYLQFGQNLLRRDGKFVGLYDVRDTGPLDTMPGPYDPRRDPSLTHLTDPVAVLRYMRNELGYKSDLIYQGPWGGGYPPPDRFRGDWMSLRWDWKADSAIHAPLVTAMLADTAMRVQVICGVYDLICPYKVNEWKVAHARADLQQRVEVARLSGGHAVYTDDRARIVLRDGVRALVLHGGVVRVPTAVAETHHAIVVDGRQLGYTARAGMLPIRHNDDGSVRAWVFFVAYVADRAPSDPARPLTFLWNGGPGANSLLLHLSAFGPRRLDTGDGGSSPRTPPRFVDNQQTLLTQSDLVFVDPAGTGFSRLADAKYADDFYGVLGDIAATREFIRVYRTRFDAWEQPVFLAGESYGTWRASGTAAAMAANDEHVAGVILISGGIPVGPLASPEMRAALFLPERVATAAYHHKLQADLQGDPARAMRDAEDWGRATYAPALRRRDALSPSERAAVVARLARYAGLDSSAIDRKTLIVDRRFWLDRLLGDGRRLGTFDARHVAGGDDASGERALISQYLRDELGFRTDLAYLDLETGYASPGAPANPNELWKYDQGDPNAPLVINNDGPPGGTPPWVQRTFAEDRATRTFVAAGNYDSLNSCALIAYQVSQLEPALRALVTPGCYGAGHMIYEDLDARVRLRQDLARFYDTTAR